MLAPVGKEGEDGFPAQEEFRLYPIIHHRAPIAHKINNTLNFQLNPQGQIAVPSPNEIGHHTPLPGGLNFLAGVMLCLAYRCAGRFS